jgi:hypothetical protein
LARTLDRVTAGDEWQGALQSARLVDAREAGVLRTAQDAGNLPWALRFLAGRRLRLMTFRWALVQHVVFTTIVLGLGLFVLLFAVAIVMPLSQLVVNLSS